MSLSDAAIRRLTPSDKPRKVFDGQGLYLEVTPAGGKLWRLKYRYAGREKRLALGMYPSVGLANARRRRDEARKLLADGIDPSDQRRADKASLRNGHGDNFEAVAREWIASRADTWVPDHTNRIVLRLQNDVFPWLGDRSITSITPVELLTVLRRVESRGAVETAHRILQNCGQIFRFAVATGRVTSDPTRDLHGALRPVNETHLASITDPRDVGGLLRAMDSYKGSLVTRCALCLAPLVFVRPGELRMAEWQEFDLEASEWNIPAERMKMRHPHLVPLSSQAIAILRELQPLTGHGRYVFPGARSAKRPMSNNAINAALRRMGYDKDTMTGHGFRAMARTVLDEVLHVRPDYIEHQLAHAVRDPNGRAYNRTTYLPERKAMMQRWADYLDALRAENVVAFKPRAAAHA